MCSYLPPGTTDADIDRYFSDRELEYDPDYSMDDYIQECNDEVWENDEKILQRMKLEQDNMDREWYQKVSEW
jgi:hypothetical protein